ncbi:MAG: hypothetical protein RL148_294 [Planctomycetota bacterium]
MISLAPMDEMDQVVLQLVVQFVVGAVFGTVCAVLAPKRGRSAVGWFFMGFFFNCLGIIVLMLVPDLKLEAERNRRRNEEARRLREQLKKERQVADQRHEEVHGRLTVHDRALGVDTGTRALPATPPPLPSPGPAPAPAPEPEVWHFARGNERLGPVGATRLVRLFEEGSIDGGTLVWRPGMPQWQAFVDVAELRGGSRG